jgi:hypothetical protein
MGVEHGGTDREEDSGAASAGHGTGGDPERSNHETTAGVGHFTGPHFVAEIEAEDVGTASVVTYLAADSVPLGVSVTTADGETGSGTLVDLSPNQAERLGRDLIERADAMREDASEE